MTAAREWFSADVTIEPALGAGAVRDDHTPTLGESRALQSVVDGINGRFFQRLESVVGWGDADIRFPDYFELVTVVADHSEPYPGRVQAHGRVDVRCAAVERLAEAMAEHRELVTTGGDVGMRQLIHSEMEGLAAEFTATRLKNEFRLPALVQVAPLPGRVS